MKVLNTHLDEGDIQQWGSSDAAAPLPSLTLGSEGGWQVQCPMAAKTSPHKTPCNKRCSQTTRDVPRLYHMQHTEQRRAWELSDHCIRLTYCVQYTVMHNSNGKVSL